MGPWGRQDPTLLALACTRENLNKARVTVLTAVFAETRDEDVSTIGGVLECDGALD